MSWDMTATFNYRRGIAVTSVEDWVRENLAAARLGDYLWRADNSLGPDGFRPLRGPVASKRMAAA